MHSRREMVLAAVLVTPGVCEMSTSKMGRCRLAGERDEAINFVRYARTSRRRCQ